MARRLRKKDIKVQIGISLFNFLILCISLLQLIFTDREHWSTESGEPSPKESFVLPSDTNWKWESNWYIDESIQCDARVFTRFYE